MNLASQYEEASLNRAFTAGFLIALAVTVLAHAYPELSEVYPWAGMVVMGLWPTGILMSLIVMVLFGIEAEAGWRTLPLFIGFAILNGATYRFIVRRLIENQRAAEDMQRMPS